MIELVEGVLSGNRRALARLLTGVENEREGTHEALAVLFPHTGRARIIGITGAPGTGKSTLVNALAAHYRAAGHTVAVVAVDPTSPFSGGAILGDRIRMRDLAGDKGIFIRSMATRGNLGGLARTTRDVVRVMDAAGFDIILVETVGAGQSEVDIARTAETTIVVEAPGLGDDVQAVKAGILEIADVLVVNKADRPGVINTVRSLKTMLELGHRLARDQFQSHHGRLLQAAEADDKIDLWMPPILETVASEHKGIDRLAAAIDQHHQYLHDHDLLEETERLHIEIELYDRLRAALMARLLEALPEASLTSVIGRIQARELEPQHAVDELLAQLPTP